MRVLIIGSGGREHALAWKCAQSSLTTDILVAPGNAGTQAEPGVTNVSVAATDIEGLVALAERESIDLTIVGPEQPLVAGVTDAFEAAGLRCFGPSQAAAQLEGSKAFTKDFLARHGIPTARYQCFSNVTPALEYLQNHPLPVVVKADGLAAGKGVIVAEDLAEATAAVKDMLETGTFGEAGGTIVIEEFLAGEEASFIALVDGDDIVPLASSQDHKARDDGDLGPNTGGMGAYSPAPVVDEAMHDRIMADIIRPTISGLKNDGIRFRGFLYAGVMIDQDGQPRVLEFNCRFGDPETQPILMRLQSDLVAMCLAATEGRLHDETPVNWDNRTAVGVVMASAGYPGSYPKGDVIQGIDADKRDPSLKVFHAGTAWDDHQIVTSGGRVLCAVALGEDVKDAADKAYRLVDGIHWPGAFCRRDIGHRAIARLAD